MGELIGFIYSILLRLSELIYLTLVNNLIGYIRIYIEIFLIIHIIITIYEFIIYLIARFIEWISFKLGNSKKLKIAINIRRKEVALVEFLKKITTGIFDANFELQRGIFSKALYYIIYSIKTLVSFKYITTRITIIMLFVYLNDNLIEETAKGLIDSLSNTKILISLKNIVISLWSVQFDKVRISVTFCLLIIVLINMARFFKYKRYSGYSQFEIELKEIEKEKIHQVVRSQDDIIHTLVEIYYIISENLIHVNEIFAHVNDTYFWEKGKYNNARIDEVGITDEIEPFEDTLIEVKDFTEKIDELKSIMKQLEKQKCIEVFNYYNNEFWSEACYLGLCNENHDFLKLSRINKPYLESTIEKCISNHRATYYKELNHKKEMELVNFEMQLLFYRNNMINYIIFIENYYKNYNRRRDKIMKYNIFSSKLKGIEDKVKSLR